MSTYEGQNSRYELSPDLEKPRVVPYALLLDADGVITNPWTRVVEERVLHKIGLGLQRNVPIFINTGRTIEWIEHSVEDPLKKLLQDNNLPAAILQNLTMLGEMGVFMTTFNQDGGKNTHPTSEEVLTIPNEMRTYIYSIVNSTFSDTMFEGDMYQTILGPQMKHGLTHEQINEYKKDQIKLKQMIETSLPPEFDIKFSSIAVEIKDKRHGKGIGARRALQLLNERGIKPMHVIAIGDSPLDIDMAKVIHDAGIPVRFIFVGDEEKKQEVENVKGNSDFVVEYKGGYNQGTAEYLENFMH